MRATDLPSSSSNDAKVLWIGDLPAGITESTLLEVFAHEDLTSVQLARGIPSGLGLGYGLLTFGSHQTAQSFLLRYNGEKIAGTALPLKLQWASTEPMTQLSSPNAAAEPDTLDSHSLFVGDLPHELTDANLHQHFQTFFPSAKSAKVITDRLSGQSKGYGFVRFSCSEDRDRALSIMHGQKIGQQTIRVNRAKAKKYQGDGLFYPSDFDASNTTAFVGNVNADITEADLFSVFRRCGDIVSIKLLKAKGCAFVTYAQRDAAERAITHLHGKVIKNSAVRLCWGRRSLHNSFPIPDPAYTQQSLAPPMPHHSLPHYAPAFSGQAFIPQPPLSASAVYTNQGFSGQAAYGFQTAPMWRPELPQEFQAQPYSGQSGFQRMFAQPFLSSGLSNFPPQFGQQQAQRDSSTFPLRANPGLAGGDQMLPYHLDGQSIYRGNPLASMELRPSMLSNSSTRAPLQASLAETEDALSRLALGQ